MNENINLLYNKLYNKSINLSYDIDKIIFENIKINDIKLSIDNEDYEIIKNEILDGQFKLDNISKNQISFKWYGGGFPTLINIRFYKHNKVSSNNDSLYSYLLSTLLLNNDTIHILAPIMNIDMKKDDIKKLIINTPLEESKQDICCLYIRENYFNLLLLSKYIINNHINYKILLFQIIHTLSVIQNHYPNFRHNNLTLDNIYLYIRDIEQIKYKFKSLTFLLPNEFEIKIGNFEYAQLDSDKHPLHDIFTFIDDLKINIKNIDSDTLLFINNIKSASSFAELLENIYFSSFIYNKQGGKTQSKHNIENNRSNKKLSTNSIMDKKKYTRKLIKDNIEHTGGSIIKPPFRTEANTPYLSNDQRDTYKKKTPEYTKPSPPVLFEQKIYDTSKKEPEKPKFPPTNIPAYDINQYFTQPNQTVQKVYNVNLANPIGDHTTINRIYEDVLPGVPQAYTSLTIFERQQLVGFIRNIMLENIDGEDMTITGGNNSLLSYIKLLDINPYTSNKNPYQDMPTDFLLYRSAYPIKFNNSLNTIGIAKPSMGINVRLYKMSIGDLLCQNINAGINSEDFDLWREIKYYNYINELVKNKVSPNFICSVLYKIDSNSRIDWNKIKLIKSGKVSYENMLKTDNNQKKINNLHQIDASSIFSNIINKKVIEKEVSNIEAKMEVFDRLKAEGRFKNKDDEEKFIKRYIKGEDTKLDLCKDSGKVLVLLTEAPTTSLLQWASSISEAFGTIRTMISTGYHAPEIWENIIFQLVYSFAVMQKKEIYLENFSIENNIYIKDLFYDANNVGSWIYKIDGIEYYVPNYGYLLLIDSKYNDIVNDSSINKLYKISSKIFTKNNDGKIYDKVFNQFKSIINPDNFKYYLKQNGGMAIDDKTYNLLKHIYNCTDKDISIYFQKFFTEYMHNRFGTLLTLTEKEKIINIPPKLTKSSLMVWEEKNNYYQWVIYLDTVEHGGVKKCKILCKIDGNVVEKHIFKGSLYYYPHEETIQYLNKPNMRYDEKFIFETYNLD